VQVKMLADTSAVVPGKPFDVAMHYKISPGWHIYWINPGESGAATKVKFDLPPGFSVSELKFPVPESIVAPGDIISYGYENESTLIATITPPSDLKPGQTVSIGTKSDWLVCKEICLTGSGEATLELPVSQSSGSANADFFKQLWFPTVPPANVSVDAKPLDLSSGKGNTEIRLAVDSSGVVEVFPYPLDDVTVTIGDANREAEMLVIPICETVLPKLSVSLKTWKVLVVSRNKGNVSGRYAYDVPITIVPGGAGAPSPQGTK
jgi:thiol:disulfide interchange protein DsbD